MKKENRYLIPALGIFLVMLLVGLFVGNKSIGTADILNVFLGKGSEVQKLIVYQVRIPRLLAASMVGAALSVSGYLLQSSLNNTLASPGILGINNGAGLFVLLYACFFPYQYAVKSIAAFLGVFLVTVIIYGLSLGTGMSKTSVVLSGVAISALCLSFIDVIISLKPETVADRAAFQLGGFASLNSHSVYFALPFVVIGLVVAVLLAPALDVMALGDEIAGGLGLNVKLYRSVQIVLAAILSGAAVSMCGVIGFVGLIVPNVVRLFYHGRSRMGILLCTVTGAAFLVFCDLLGRVLAFPYELPCGLFLSLTGAPFLIWLLIKKRKRLGA